MSLSARCCFVVGLLNAVLVSGCYGPGFRRCAVSCGDDDQCPGASICGPDRFCHEAASAAEIVECSAAERDAGIGDGDGGGDDGPDEPAEVLPCPGPHLLVAVEDLANDDDLGGRIARTQLGSDGMTTRCTELTARGTLTPQPTSLAWVGPGKIAIATRTELVLLDEATDARIWTVPFDQTRLAVDVFVVDNGLPMIAVGFAAPTGIGEIGPVELYRVSDGQLADAIDAPSGRVGMTQDPLDPSLFLAVKAGSYAGAEHSLGGVQLAPPPLFRLHTDGVMHTIHALHDGQIPRFAWAATQVSTNLPVFFYYNGEPTGDTVPFGPLSRCATQPLHVVPDPTLNTRFIAIGETDGVRHVVRFKTTDSMLCDTLFTPMTSKQRFSRLAVALSD